MAVLERNSEQKSMALINILSVAIPVVIAILLSIPQKVDIGAWTKVLPHIIGAINTLTSVLLIYGLVLIKQKQIERHRKVMSCAFFLGALFLVCYVLYHLTNESTKYGDKESTLYPIYLIVLFSHILLSFVVLPLVLRAYYFAYTKQFERHKKMTRFAFPIWLYVSITGVVAYLMIKPYYQLPIIN